MSPLPLIDVEPEVFHAASQVMGRCVAAQIASALVALEQALAGTGAMAGTDTAGTTWASSYDSAVADTVAAITDLSNGCYRLAALLERTGFNHGMAESASDPTRSVPTPADTSGYLMARSISCLAPPPPATGGSGSAPHGWGMIAHLVGYAWPNGHQAELRTAADAWSSAARSLDWASYAVDEAVQAISSQRSPEVEDACAVVRGMKQHIQDVADCCRSLSAGCSQFAGYLDHAHHEVEHELVSLLEWTAGIEVAGGLFSVVTVGLSEAGAQAMEATRIAATASRVASIIVRLIDLAATVANVVTKIAEVAQRLKVILGARLSEATATLVARLPAFTDDAGAISYGRLTAWSKGWSARGFEIEAELGGNLPRSFPTIDRFENGVVTSIKSVDLTSPTYQSTTALTSKLERYIAKIANFDGANWGGKSIVSRDITERSLQIAIQPGVASSAQRTVLDRLATYAKSNGVKLIISEVP